jgi:hypothetical protein
VLGDTRFIQATHDMLVKDLPYNAEEVGRRGGEFGDVGVRRGDESALGEPVEIGGTSTVKNPEGSFYVLFPHAHSHLHIEKGSALYAV